ncbi:MAG: hypothetical protein NC388_00370 [Clostridium sp.]|nr:hypothetical protein [Clostridium sp.]
MKHIVLPDPARRRLIFYLALEEFLAHESDKESFFFIWQVDPTVIFGRNQMPEAEVNVDYCRANGIQIYRRKSGGGCVYADPGNLMLSCIVAGDNVPFLFDSYLRRIAFLLQQAGINATASGRNDILVDGRKVSGNAFYRLPEKSIIHGTMLYDTRFDRMQQAITPSGCKLQSKGVASVRQHVTNLKDHTDMGIEELKTYFISRLCNGERMLTEEEVRQVEQIEQTYLADDFLHGKHPRYTVEKRGRTRQAGEVITRIDLKGERIQRIRLEGDFFVLRPADEELTRLLKGLPLERTALRTALETTDLKEWILNLNTEEWIEQITQ